MRALLFFAALLEFLPLGEGFTGLAFHSAGLITAAGLLPFRGIAQARGEFKLGVPGRIKLPHLNTCLPGTSCSNLLRPPTSKRNSALVRSLSNDLTEVQNPDSEDQFQNLEAQIARVETQIASVEATIQAAEDKANAAADTNERDYWREKEKQLREKEKQLREKEKQLREKESDLRKLALQGGTAGSVGAQETFLFLDGLDAVAELEVTADTDSESVAVWTGSWLAAESQSALFIRPCFEALFRTIKACWDDPLQKRVLLTGTPGTGKTCFQSFVARKLLQDRARDFNVIVAVEPLQWVCVSPSGERKTGRSLVDFMDETSLKTTVLLQDVYDKTPPIARPCRHLVTASLNRERYSDFEKQSCTTLYFPLWTITELELCRCQCFPDVQKKDLHPRFAKWGGVVRWTIGSGSAQSGDAFDQALTKMQFSEAFTAMTTGQVDDSKLSHRLIHFSPSPEKSFRTGSFRFASTVVCQRVMEMGARDAEAMAARLIATTTSSPIAQLQGQLFEWFAHRSLSSRDSLVDCRNLDDDSLLTFRLGPRTLVEFQEMTEVTDDQYGVPQARNLAAVDSIAPPRLAFQMTTNSDHGLNVAGLQRAVAAMPGLEAAIFVVPDFILATFPTQSYRTTNNKVFQKPLPNEVRDIKVLVYGISLAANLTV